MWFIMETLARFPGVGLSRLTSKSFTDVVPSSPPFLGGSSQSLLRGERGGKLFRDAGVTSSDTQPSR